MSRTSFSRVTLAVSSSERTRKKECFIILKFKKMIVKEGMIVWLKTGGPAMTVSSLARPNTWICKWFVGTKLSHSQFKSEDLTDKDPNQK